MKLLTFGFLIKPLINNNHKNVYKKINKKILILDHFFKKPHRISFSKFFFLILRKLATPFQ